jgi:lipoprotein-releasing system permease protein
VGISEIGIAEIECDELYLIVHGSKLLGQPKSYITDLQVNLDKESVPLAKEFHTAFNLDAIDYQTAN